MNVPPIPARCEGLPTIGGLVAPWGNVHLADGGVDFRALHTARHVQCWRQRLCQVCAQRLTQPTVLFGGPQELRQLLFTEPGLHPECAVYTSWACPMVAGHQERFADRAPVSAGKRGQRCYEPGCDCGGWVHEGSRANRAGQEAHPWYAVYVNSYNLALYPDRSVLGAHVHPDQVRAVRVVCPGRSRWPTMRPPR